jgi:hypothetical protein
MYHPLNAIPQGKRLPTFLWLLTATVGLSVVFRLIGPFKPNIVDFELAGIKPPDEEKQASKDKEKTGASFSMEEYWNSFKVLLPPDITMNLLTYRVKDVQGMTPEDQIMYAMTHLEETNEVHESSN